MADEIQKATEDLKVLLQAIEAVNATTAGAAQIKPVMQEIGGKEGMAAYAMGIDTQNAGFYVDQLNEMIEKHEKVNELIREQIQLTQSATKASSNFNGDSEPTSGGGASLRSTVASRPPNVTSVDRFVRYVQRNPTALDIPADTYDEETIKKLLRLQQGVMEYSQGRTDRSQQAQMGLDFRSLFPIPTDNRQDSQNFGLMSGGSLPLRRSVGNRPRGVSDVDSFVKYVLENPHSLDVPEDTYDEETTKKLLRLQRGVAEYSQGRSNRREQAQMGRDFRSVFPVPSTALPQDTRSSISTMVSAALNHIGMGDRPAARNLDTANDQYLLDVLDNVLDRITVLDPDTGVPQQTAVPKDLIRSQINRAVSGINKVVENALKRRSYDPSETDPVDSDAPDWLQALNADFEDSGLGVNATAVNLGMNVYKTPGATGNFRQAPRGADGGTVYSKKQKFGKSSNDEARSSFRKSIRGDWKAREETGDTDEYSAGSQVSGYEATSVFPISSSQKISEDIKAQRRQVNEEIVAGDMEPVEIGGKIVQVPRSLAKKKDVLVRAVRAMSKDTTLVGRRAQEGGTKEETGIYGSGSLEQETVNLHAAAMLEHYLSNPMERIESGFDSDFMQRVVIQETEDTPNAETQNAGRLYAQRSIESLQEKANSANKKRQTSTNPSDRDKQERIMTDAIHQKEFIEDILFDEIPEVPAGASEEEAEAHVKYYQNRLAENRGEMLKVSARGLSAKQKARRESVKRKMTDDLISQGYSKEEVLAIGKRYKAGNTLSDKERELFKPIIEFDRDEPRTTEIKGKYEPFTVDQALAYIYGSDLTQVPDFKDASIGIRRYATEVSERLAAQGEVESPPLPRVKKDTTPARTKDAVLELGRTTALEEAGTGTGTGVMRRSLRFGEEYGPNERYAERLIQLSNSKDEVERREALETIALHRAVAEARGYNPDDYAQGGIVGENEGFTGDNVARANQFLNYVALKRRADNGDESAQEDIIKIDKQRKRVQELDAGTRDIPDFQYQPMLGEGAFSRVSKTGRSLFQNTPYSGQIKKALMQDKYGEDVYESGVDLMGLADAVEAAEIPDDISLSDEAARREAIIARNPDLRMQIAKANRDINRIGREDQDSILLPHDLSDVTPGGEADQIDDILMQLIEQREYVDSEGVVAVPETRRSYEAENMVEAQLKQMAEGASKRLTNTKAAVSESELSDEERTLLARAFVIDLQKPVDLSSTQTQPKTAAPPRETLTSNETRRVFEIRKRLVKNATRKMAVDPEYATVGGRGLPQLLEIASLMADDRTQNASAYKLTNSLENLEPEDRQFLNQYDLSKEKQRREAVEKGSARVRRVLGFINFDDRAIENLLSYNPVVGLGEENTRRGNDDSTRVEREAKTGLRQIASDAASVREASQLNLSFRPEPTKTERIERTIAKISKLNLDEEEDLLEAERIAGIKPKDRRRTTRARKQAVQQFVDKQNEILIADLTPEVALEDAAEKRRNLLQSDYQEPIVEPVALPEPEPALVAPEPKAEKPKRTRTKREKPVKEVTPETTALARVPSTALATIPVPPTPREPLITPSYSETTALARVPSTALARVLTAALATVPPSTALATVPSSTALARVVTTALATVPASTALATVPSSTALAKVITTALATVPRVATPPPTTVTAPTTPLLTGPTTTALATVPKSATPPPTTTVAPTTPLLTGPTTTALATVPKTPAPATPATTAPPATTTALAVVPKTPAPSTAATPATPTVPPATTALAVVPKTPTPATPAPVAPAPKAPIITPPPAAATASTVPLLTGPTAPTTPRAPRAPRAPKPTTPIAPTAPAPLITFSGAPTAPIVLPTVPPVTVTPRAPRAPRAPKPAPAPVVPFSGAPTAPLPTITVPPVAPATGPAGTSPSTAPSGGGITAPGATITVTGGTVTITGSTVTGGTGGAGGAGGSGTGGTGGTGGGGGGGGGFRRSNLTDMIFGQMDVLSDRTKDVIREAPDEPARIALVQAARDRYAKLQQKALQTQIDYGSPSMILNPTVPGLVAGLDTSKNPLQDLNTMTEAVLQDQIASAVERDRIENDPTLSAADRKLELAALDASDRELNDFAAVLKKVTEDLNRFQQAVRVPNTAFGNTSGRSGGGGGGPTIRTASGKVLSEADVLALSDLESKRNLYASFQGNLPNLGSRFDSQLDLTRRTRRFADATLSQLPAVDLTGVDFMGDVAKETAANAAAAELQDAIAQIKPNTLETRPIEELAVDLSRVNEAAIKLNDVIEGAGNVDAAQSGIQNVVTATGFAERQQARSGAEIDKQSASNARNLEENMQAIVSQPGLIRRLTGGVQREGAEHVREYLKGIFGDSKEGRKATDTMFYKDQMVAYDDQGRRRNIVGASTKELQNLQARVKAESGMDVSMDDLQRTQRAMARVQQARNQSPFNDILSYSMSKMRDLDSLGQTVMGAMNAPQTIASTISQIGDPQLRTDRIMTTARALSLSPETYTKALAAATQQQSRFGGTLSKNLEDMTSFIPISNTYGVDVGKSVQVARKLAAFDPAQGMQGASIALKEFLSGNVSSLSRRFEINRSDLSKINTGDANEMLDSLDTLLGKMGVTDKLIDDQANSLATKYDRMTGRLETMQVSFSAFAVSAMTPVLEPILGDKSFLAKGALDQNLQKVVTERLKSYGDSVLSDPETGLKTVDVFSSKFAEQLDPILAKANDSTSTAALDFTGITGNVSNVELYRRLGNMSADDRRRIQQSAQSSVLMGMNQEPAILKAMRDVGGDFFSGEEFQAQRRPLGFYGPAMSPMERRDLSERAGEALKFGQRGQQVQLLRKLDADTYDVRLPSGKIDRVRLAGVDAPEKNTDEGKQASEFAGRVIGTDLTNPESPKKFVTLYSKGNRDENDRLVGSLNVNGNDLATTLIASGNAAAFNFEGSYGQDVMAPLSALERNAANIGIGPVNARAAGLGLGANSEISEAVKTKYFYDKYVSLAALYGGVGGATAGTLVGGYNALAALGSAGGLAAGGGAATGIAAAPILPIAGAVATLVAGGYLGVSAYNDSKDTSAPKMRELNRLQSEEDLLKAAGNIGDQLYPQAAKQTQEDEARIKDLVANGKSDSANAFMLYRSFFASDLQKPREEFVTQFVDSGKELSKYYNGLAEEQKEVYGLVVTDPATKQRTSVFRAMQMFQTLQKRDETKTDPTAKKILEENFDAYTDLNRRIDITTKTSKLIETAQAYGIQTTYKGSYEGQGPPRASRYVGPVTKVMDRETFFNLNEDQQIDVAKQLNDAINTPSWKRFAKEYADQAMEKQAAMSQQRFTTYVDNTALNSLAGMNPGQLSSSVFGFRSTGTGRALEDPLDGDGNPISPLVAPSIRALTRTKFAEGVNYDESGKENLKNAQAEAVKSLEQQIVAYREQEELTRPFNLALKSTYSNFIQTLQKSGTQYGNIMTYLSQGNPRGFLDVSQQMSGFNVQSIMQNRITTQNSAVMGIGSVAAGTSGPVPTGRSFNYGYTTGPQGTIQYARDFMRAPERSLFNPAAIESVIMQGVQANTEIVQRNLDFGRKLRDAEIANRRALEDINRNGMRSLEDIHRNYTRNMIQLAQQSETSKRLGTAQFYTGAVAANIDPNEKARITASREQGQQKASHIEQADVGTYLKSSDGMQDTELQKAYAEYQATPFTNATVKEESWKKVMDIVQVRRSQTKARMENATEVPERSAAEAQFGLLSDNYDRGQQYRKYVDDMYNQQMEFAGRRKQLGINRVDLEREGGRLREKTPELAMQLGKARTPEEIRAARNAIEDNNVAIEKNSEALAQNARELESVTITAPLWADNWREAGKQILESSTSTISGLLNNLEDFNINYARQLEDAYLGFKNAKKDMIKQFTDAAIEISQAVPAEFAGALSAITSYQRMSLKAESYYNAGKVESAQTVQRLANVQLASSLYPKGSDEYNSMVSQLDSNVTSMTAQGMQQNDLTMGPSGLGAYGEKDSDGKFSLRVVMKDKARDPLRGKDDGP